VSHAKSDQFDSFLPMPSLKVLTFKADIVMATNLL